MKVIFVKELSGSGKRGEVKEVSDGYAKNFLIAKGFAQIATPDILAKVEKEKKEAAAKHQKNQAGLQALRNDLEKQIFKISLKVGDKGQIFSSVHDKDIAHAINAKLKIHLDRHQIFLDKPIKDLGEHQAKVKLAPAIIANLKINVEAE